MNRRETERILQAIHDVRAAGARAALATVVRVRGSAYRREGARILVREDGTYECLLSGGCLEPAVAEAAARVIETGTPILKQYDLEEDSVWSLAIGCSGAVDILIERLEDDAATRAWVQALERGEPAVLVKSLTGASRGLLVREQDHDGSLGDDALDRQALTMARARLHTSLVVSGADRAGDTDLFFDPIGPPPELVIFGAGFDADPLARHGWELGFAVTLVDPRETFLTADRFPHATLVAAHADRLPTLVSLSPRSWVVIMNHHVERDRECLRFVLGSHVPYIGLLGPRVRYTKLLAALRADGLVPGPAALSRVRSPVGLALGAETAEEIAVSILGEVLALQRGFDAGFLSGREASLHHRPAASRATARS
jgi:xanthine dehydrogenase accessory factor